MYKKEDRIIRIPPFEEIREGDKAELSHMLTREDVQSFAALTGDFNPLHVDEDFAKKTMFQKPVVHGMLSASFISTMIGMCLPGGGALWISQALDFLRPVYIGDTITVFAEVKQKSSATRIIVLKIIVINQHGEEVITGESAVKILQLKNGEVLMDKNKKKVVLITGGSGGIGTATAVRLAKDGNLVVINYLHSVKEAEETVARIVEAGGKGICVKADITNIDEVKNLFAVAEKSLGHIEAIVHCAAGNNVPQSFDKLDWNSFQEQLDVQLKGAFNCVKLALPKMLEDKAGDIVFIGTVYTDGVPPVQQSRYVTAKSALTSLARCLSVEYGPSGIRVNVVSPGMTQTSMIADLPEKVKMLTKMQTPLRRLAEASDIANTVAFLLSAEAGHITGENIRVCGGINMV